MGKGEGSHVSVPWTHLYYTVRFGWWTLVAPSPRPAYAWTGWCWRSCLHNPTLCPQPTPHLHLLNPPTTTPPAGVRTNASPGLPSPPYLAGCCARGTPLRRAAQQRNWARGDVSPARTNNTDITLPGLPRRIRPPCVPATALLVAGSSLAPPPAPINIPFAVAPPDSVPTPQCTTTSPALRCVGFHATLPGPTHAPT